MRPFVTQYSPLWADQFSSERDRLKQTLGDSIVHIHHIGSTSIEGMIAKPIIDILIEARSLEDLDRQSSAIETIGYQVMGEFGIPTRRYYRKDSPNGSRSHHIHAFETDSEHLVRHIAFRDYLIAHPECAKKYAQIKHDLTSCPSVSMDDYISGKDPFIKETEIRAMSWYLGHQRG